MTEFSDWSFKQQPENREVIVAQVPALADAPIAKVHTALEYTVDEGLWATRQTHLISPGGRVIFSDKKIKVSCDFLEARKIRNFLASPSYDLRRYSRRT
jgi:hypothetical protein